MYLRGGSRRAGSTLWFVPVVHPHRARPLGVHHAIDRAFDYDLIPHSLTGGPATALQILGTIALSMVSLTALVLTITMVVVQLAMGQVSPRIVQTILHNKPSQVAIGVFVATFAPRCSRSRGQRRARRDRARTRCCCRVRPRVHEHRRARRVCAPHRAGAPRVGADRTRRRRYSPAARSGVPRSRRRTVSRCCRGRGRAVAVIGRRDGPRPRRPRREPRRAGVVLELVPAIGEFVPCGAPLFRVHGSLHTLDTNRQCVASSCRSNARLITTRRTASACSSTSRNARSPIHRCKIRPLPCKRSIGCTTVCARSCVARCRTASTATSRVKCGSSCRRWTGTRTYVWHSRRSVSPERAHPSHATPRGPLRDLRAIAPEDRRLVLEEQLDLLDARSKTRATTGALRPSRGGQTPKASANKRRREPSTEDIASLRPCRKHAIADARTRGEGVLAAVTHDPEKTTPCCTTRSQRRLTTSTHGYERAQRQSAVRGVHR